MFGQRLFIDELDLSHVDIMAQMFNYSKFFTKARKALEKLPVQTKVWTSAYHNDFTYGGLKFEVYDNRGRTIASIEVTYERGEVSCVFNVTRNQFKNYTEWVKYLTSSVKKYYKEQIHDQSI